MPWILVPLGFGAGALSTVTGMGGGVLMVVILSVLRSPHEALAISTPALLVGNVHRVSMFFRSIDPSITWTFAGAAFVGALIGGFVTVALPPAVLSWVLLGAAAFAAVRALGWVAWTPGRRSFGPAGFAAGALASTSGAGVLVSPLLLAAGLKGEVFIATSSATAIAIHVASLVGYGVGGLLTTATLFGSVLVCVGLLAGNLIGRRIRERVGERATLALTYAVLGIVVALAVIGVS